MSLVTNLTTTFTNIGTAVKATRAMIGTLASLNTTEKTNLVGAINEVLAAASSGAPIDDTTPAVDHVYSSTKTQALADSKVPTTREINGHDLSADLTLAWSDFSGTIPTGALPALAITDVFAVASQSAMLALTAQRGDVAVRSDNGKTYILSTDDPTTLANWLEMTAVGQVTSVAGHTGAVTLSVSDVTGAQASSDIGDTSHDFSSDFSTALTS